MTDLSRILEKPPEQIWLPPPCSRPRTCCDSDPLGEVWTEAAWREKISYISVGGKLVDIWKEIRRYIWGSAGQPIDIQILAQNRLHADVALGWGGIYGMLHTNQLQLKWLFLEKGTTKCSKQCRGSCYNRLVWLRLSTGHIHELSVLAHRGAPTIPPIKKKRNNSAFQLHCHLKLWILGYSRWEIFSHVTLFCLICPWTHFGLIASSCASSSRS